MKGILGFHPEKEGSGATVGCLAIIITMTANFVLMSCHSIEGRVAQRQASAVEVLQDQKVTSRFLTSPQSNTPRYTFALAN